MKLIIISAILFLNLSVGLGQASLEQLSLTAGEYEVGFEHYLAVDSTRTYERRFDWNNQKIYRPIPVSLWYPSSNDSGKNTQMRVIDYLEILKEEEEWEYLPNEQILNFFHYQNSAENQAHLKERSTAYLNLDLISQKFPVIIYAPSYQASSIENFALCEFLASYGYIIISSPSRGTKNRFLEGGTEKDMETQARDIEFLIKEISSHSNADQDRIASMGFSFGGLSNVLAQNVLAQMRNGTIKAIVSLDGSIKYQYATLQKSPFASIENMNVPFIHFAQETGVNYKISFNGCRKGQSVPEEFKAIDGSKADFELTDDILFVRCRVISSKLHGNPIEDLLYEMAWTQPVTIHH